MNYEVSMQSKYDLLKEFWMFDKGNEKEVMDIVFKLKA